MSRKCFNEFVTNHLTLTNGGLELFGKPVEYVWVQGIIVRMIPNSLQFHIDDGTSNLLVIAESLGETLGNFKVGDYILVQGSVTKGEEERTGEIITILEARIVSPLNDPNMETLWFLEVIAATERSRV